MTHNYAKRVRTTRVSGVARDEEKMKRTAGRAGAVSIICPREVGE